MSHQLREVCDTLLIGGNTVRVDRPTLDCRFTEWESTRILSFIRKVMILIEIYLFSILENREVKVTDTFRFFRQAVYGDG